MGHYKTLFLSDIHLGTRGCQASMVLELLRETEAETIYLLGDIVDGWRLRRSWYWPQLHNDVVQKLLRKARKGTRVVYVPGNHDEFMRDFLGNDFGGIEIVDQALHETVDGKRYLVIHGDQFDVVVRHAKWLALLGDWSYRSALKVNLVVNFCRRKLGFSYWSLSAWAKMKVKNAVNFIGNFEEALVHAAAEQQVDGVICGHIHHAASHHHLGLHYVNTGDWVESCSAVVEHHDGTLELIEWGERRLQPEPSLRSSDTSQVAA
ncbi:UDP-2,3-diacylglucosamine diphosphatase [Flexibacterium corallicola]|uniref:UDP-2,3-diacylglucosamine diphosphatase n=1 Tax=Flexibacterium corallicola TaxID=3037259 RepID=UPI00286ED9C9|nr:UDP-2,3-diacylglucosamine diphosphatase [Pseudovibrio sp. M1P-2-3]